MAVIDDLAAITLIAVLFTAGRSRCPGSPAAAAAGALYWLAFRLRLDRAWLLWALAVAAWIALHASGVHATVAGIVLGLLTPVRPRAGEEARRERLEHRLHPLSAGLVVPVFALAAAGIPLAAAGDALGDAIAIGVFAGLLIGKVTGILGGARLAVAAAARRAARARRLGRRAARSRCWAAIGYTVAC